MSFGAAPARRSDEGIKTDFGKTKKGGAAPNEGLFHRRQLGAKPITVCDGRCLHILELR